MEITVAGITRDRLIDIQDDINNLLIEKFGTGFVTTTDNPIIRVTDIFASIAAILEEQMELDYNSKFPSSASGASLDEVASVTGHIRQIAVATAAPSMLAGTPSTIIAAGSIVSQTQTGIQFSLRDAVTLNSLAHASVSTLTQVAGTATCTTGAAHGFITGDYVFIVGADQTEYNGVHQVTVTGGTTFTFSVDSGAVSPATGTITAKIGTLGTFDAVETGPIQALAGTIVTIENPISGWDHLENHIDATIGRNVETDAEFRARRTATLAQLGSATLEAIRSTVLNVSGVSSATVFENPSGDIVDGRPPYSIEVFVTGGADTDIAQAIFDSRHGGGRRFGTEGPFPIIDSDGNSHDYYFSRLTSVLIHVYMKILKNTDPDQGPLYPGDGDDQIREAIAVYEASLLNGYEVIPTPDVMAAIGSVPGVDVQEFYVVKSTGSLPGDPANPGDLHTTIPIAETEIADFDSTKIWINGTPGT
jgi:uncharacterized phage protein gp47/JayE